MQNAHIPIHCPTYVHEDFLRCFLGSCFPCHLHSTKGYVALSNLKMYLDNIKQKKRSHKLPLLVLLERVRNAVRCRCLQLSKT